MNSLVNLEEEKTRHLSQKAMGTSWKGNTNEQVNGVRSLPEQKFGLQSVWWALICIVTRLNKCGLRGNVGKTGAWNAEKSN